MTANSKCAHMVFFVHFSAWRSKSDNFFPPLQWVTFRNIIADFATVSAKAQNTPCFRGEKAIFSFLF